MVAQLGNDGVLTKLKGDKMYMAIQHKDKKLADLGTVGGRIRYLRSLVPKRTAEEFGALLGVSGGAVRNWEAGSKASADNMIAIAEATGAPLEWITTGGGEIATQSTKNKIVGRDILPVTLQGIHVNGGMTGSGTLAVFATVDNGNGEAVMLATKIVERKPRPYAVEGRSDAYGLFISGNTMAPAFRYGDTAWVDPMLPFATEMEVVLYRAGSEALDERPIFIGTLVSFTDKEWTVEVTKPAKRYTISRAEWPTCHRIVAKDARR